eukprot:CAMPEP_0117063432 /NCGR_PEP_ID=MMETSP0472-20121206/44270_1 /TAXON_ID=693140 ORGANISM="Tiarina fusus, Strain LIS" /NCGR_SAMPLE_ID=MMETSP0472 /ASSEMBLY_ACC=CAM_ASM_000603 /LENGTH=71 /DNA_ID=CAMNT_0004783111 /DNA_START=32 /DNA_END=247 /DNA_ORIENTATION=-
MTAMTEAGILRHVELSPDRTAIQIRHATKSSVDMPPSPSNTHPLVPAYVAAWVQPPPIEDRDETQTNVAVH